MKNKKIVYLVVAISAVVLAAVLIYAYRPTNKQAVEKIPQAKQANDTKETKPTAKQPKKPPEVKTYKQEVIMSISFDTGDKDQAVVIPKDPKKYGLAKEGNEMDDWGPSSIAVDRQENIYVLDSVASRIKKYDKDGNFIKNIPSPYEWPNDIAVDNEGNLYILDAGEYSVLKIDQDGKVILEYPLPEGIAPRWASSLYSIDIVSDTLYGIQSFDKHSTPDLFELEIEGLREGETASFKIGTTKKPFNSKQQEKSIQAGISGKDGNIYDWKEKSRKIIYFSPNNASIRETIRISKYRSAGIGSQNLLIDDEGNLYDSYTIEYKNSYAFLIQRYSKGHLVAEAILPYGSDYQWTKLAAVSDTGNIYYLYSDALSSDYKGGVKVIKCVLK